MAHCPHQPLFAADVIVAGTGLGGITDRNGRFTIGDVPAGSHRVTVSMMGYEVVAVDDVEVRDGSATTMRFELPPRVLDIGLDVLNPIQPACLDLKQLSETYGDRLCFWPSRTR